jgi:hypothetical protein
MFVYSENMYTPGDVLSLCTPHGNILRAIHLGNDTLVWFFPESGKIIYSNFKTFKFYGKEVNLDLKYQYSSRGYSSDIIVERALNYPKNITWTDNESFVGWVINNTYPKKDWCKTILAASIGFYFGGPLGALVSARVAYSS